MNPVQTVQVKLEPRHPAWRAARPSHPSRSLSHYLCALCVICGALVLLQAPPVAAQSRTAGNREAEREYRFGIEMVENGMHTSAIPFFRSVLENYPQSDRADDARFQLASSLLAVGDAEALELFREILRRNPQGSRLADARYGLARALLDRNLLGEAVAGFDEFASKHASDPRAPWARYYQGLALVRLNRPLDAIPLFRAAADSGTAELKAEADYQRAAALHLAGRSEEAVEPLTVVARLYPNSEAQGKADQLSGDILFRRGRYAEARQSYTDALRSPIRTADEAWYWRAWAAIRMGDTRTGAVELAAMGDSWPEGRRTIAALKQAAEQFEILPDPAAARRVIERLVLLAPSPADRAYAHFQRGRLAFAAGDTLAAREAMLAILPLGAGFEGEAQYVLGLLELTARNYPSAESFLKQAEVLLSGDADYLEKIQAARLEGLRLSGNATGYAELVRVLEERRSPALARALYQGAELLEQQNDQDGAARDYTRVIERFPATAEAGRARYRLGVIRYLQARYTEAETTLARFLSGPPAPVAEWEDDAWYWTGFSLFQRQKSAEAIEAFRRAAAIPGADKAAEAVFRAGNAAYNLRDYSRAAEFFRAAAEHAAATPTQKLDARFNLAESLRQLGEGRQARATFLAVFQDGGADYEQALLNACAVLEDLDLPDSAAAAYEAAATRFTALGRQEEAWLKAGENRARLGQYARAGVLFLNAVDLGGPLAADALIRLGEVRLSAGETTAALEAFGAAAERYPSSHFGRRATLRLALLAPRTETTVTLLENLIEAAPEDPASAEARLRLGLLARADGRIDSAIAYLRLALQHLPDADDRYPEARVALAGIHADRRQWAQARTMAELIYRGAMFRMSPWRGTAGLHLGRALGGLGNRSEALKVLRETADGYPEVAAEARAAMAALPSTESGGSR